MVINPCITRKGPPPCCAVIYVSFNSTIYWWKKFGVLHLGCMRPKDPMKTGKMLYEYVDLTCELTCEFPKFSMFSICSKMKRRRKRRRRRTTTTTMGDTEALKPPSHFFRPDIVHTSFQARQHAQHGGAWCSASWPGRRKKMSRMAWEKMKGTLGGGLNIFYFHPYLGKIPILTNIFQGGWNHQLGFWGY